LLDFKFYVVLFESFVIDILFWLISELFSELKFTNFFPNFFTKILRVRKFRSFPKKFWPTITEHFRISQKRKVRKILSNAGPYFKPKIKLCNFCRQNFVQIRLVLDRFHDSGRQSWAICKVMVKVYNPSEILKVW